jgi:Transglutaminase-like superfamily
MMKLSFLSCVLSAASLIVAAKLPYRTGELKRATNVDEPPALDGRFRVGHLVWDTPVYAREPRLEPLRVFFREHCPNSTGGAAAVCLSDVFARTFRPGSPATELFDPVYDPVADLAVHLKGQHGHCVTRSGLISAILLSAGIPAQVVQLHSPSGVGHNVMSVWDQGQGWIIFDPSFGTYAAVDGKPASVAQLANRPEDLAALPGGLVPEGEQVTAREYYVKYAARGLTIPIPEPWLYMRVGEHAAHWPFRGSFAITGAHLWRVGPAQDVARISFLFFALLGVGAGLTAGARRARRGVVTAPASPSSGLEPAE